MLRFGLCCIFRDEPIRFRQTTAKALLALAEKERLQKLSALCLENANSLVTALEAAHRFGIGAFRVSSQFLPRYTHPVVGYTLDSLPDFASIAASLEKVNQLREQWDLRLSFHPDQFVLLSSPSAEVTRKSIAELDYQAMLAEMIGADVVNIHAGGVYGDKQAALKRLRENTLDRLRHVLGETVELGSLSRGHRCIYSDLEGCPARRSIFSSLLAEERLAEQ